MSNFIHILTAPDNIPIVAMTIFLVVVLWVAAKEAAENDRLLDEGKFEEMSEQMRH